MNHLGIKVSLLVSALALFSAACSANTDELTNGKGKRKTGTKTEGSACSADEECESGVCDPTAKVCTASDSISAALQCNAKAEGTRSYKLFDGTNLEDKRANEGTGVNRARMKPHAVLASEFKRVIGTSPAGLDGAGATFSAPAARWFAEPTYSGVTINKAFDLAFEGCLTYVPTNAAMKSAPTETSAKAECTSLMRKAWSHSPSPAEVEGCTDLAVNKLGTETDTTRRWAYVCASILSSSQFLTY